MIYVASSWRNVYQPAVINILRAAHLKCYDFRSDSAFGWNQIDPKWEQWDLDEYQEALKHPLAVRGFDSDFNAMQESDTFILVLPCGRSAHLELGWAVGAGKKTAILLPTPEGRTEPELMYKMADFVTTSVYDLLGWLGVEN